MRKKEQSEWTFKLFTVVAVECALNSKRVHDFPIFHRLLKLQRKQSDEKPRHDNPFFFSTKKSFSSVKLRNLRGIYGKPQAEFTVPDTAYAIS